MKILITGATGQLGSDCTTEFKARGHEVYGVSSHMFPLSDERAMRAVLEEFAPDSILHYEADDPKGPKNVYGASKLAGEEAVAAHLTDYFIVRISWVFGTHGKNFVKTMLSLADTHKSLSIVSDQIGSPTYTRDLAPLLADMSVSDRYGVYHATNEGFCSWAEFAREIFRAAGKDVAVTSVPSRAYPTKAARPKNSRLSKKSLDAAGFRRLPPWQDAVARFLAELKQDAQA